MTEPREPLDHGQEIDQLLSAARGDRPAATDEERLERRVLGAIAAGTVATVVMPASKAAALARIVLSKPVASFALLLVGAGAAAWIATHDAHDFLAPARTTPAASATAPRARVETKRIAAPRLAPSPPQALNVSPTLPTRPAHPALRAPTPHVVVPVPVPDAPVVIAEERGTTPEVPEARANDVPAVVVPSETSLLVRARSSLRAEDMRGLLAVISEHDARYPSGQFTEEFDLLRVEALAGTGRSAEARARAAQFARQWPGSPYAERVRRAVGTGAP